MPQIDTYPTATPVGTDRLLLVDDPGGTPSTKLATVQSVADLGAGGISNVVEDTTPQLGGDLNLNDKLFRDANGNIFVDWIKAVSAVNYFQFYNSATGAGPSIAAVGADANVDLFLSPKGTGDVKDGDTGGVFWHAGNDGAGSGLDADTVDGSEATALLARANHTGTQTASTISNFDTQVRTSRIDQMAAPTAARTMNSQKHTGLAAGTTAGDSVRYEQVLRLVGGTMSGAIAMGASKITGLAAGTANGDALRYEQLIGAYLPLTGGTLSGALAMGANKVTGLAAATANGDAVRYEQWKTRWVGIALSDETTTITTGTNKATMSLPYACTLLSCYASVNTVSTSGLPTVDINEAGTTVLSTKLTIDANEKTSATAATPHVISDSSIAANAEIGFDIDVAGTGAKGLKVWIQVREA